MNFTLLSSVAHIGRSLFVASTLCAAMAAHAVPIVYTFFGSASGTLGSTSFANRLLTVTIATDTTNINTTRFGAGIPATQNLVSGSISVTGVGSGSFTPLLYVFNNQSTQTVGFGSLASNDLINITNASAGLNTYGLVTNLNVGGPSFVSQFNNVGTSFGNLTVNALLGARFIAALAPIPEPGTYGLMAGGLAFVGAIARRRSRGRG